MSDYSQILVSNDFIKFLPKSSLLTEFPHIAIDPLVQGGQPHIKGTRILASEVFIAQLEKISLDKLIMEYKQIDVHVSKEQLQEAFQFTLASISRYLHEKKTSKRNK